ncbi:MAG: hypothetical protein J6B85_06965 [Lachnospiraceae bacterium]|nr:hypothetical protein [Lachnospiraceae bacterium]
MKKLFDLTSLSGYSINDKYEESVAIIKTFCKQIVAISRQILQLGTHSRIMEKDDVPAPDWKAAGGNEVLR